MPTTPSCIALDDANHDIYLDDTGNLALHTDTVSIVRQRIKCRLQTVQNEWYQQPDVGVPLFSDVLVKNPNLTTLKHLFTTVIGGTPGVKSVNSIELSLNAATRVLNITFDATATDGTSVTGSI